MLVWFPQENPSRLSLFINLRFFRPCAVPVVFPQYDCTLLEQDMVPVGDFNYILSHVLHCKVGIGFGTPRLVIVYGARYPVAVSGLLLFCPFGRVHFCWASAKERKSTSHLTLYNSHGWYLVVVAGEHVLWVTKNWYSVDTNDRETKMREYWWLRFTFFCSWMSQLKIKLIWGQNSLEVIVRIIFCFRYILVYDFLFMGNQLYAELFLAKIFITFL